MTVRHFCNSQCVQSMFMTLRTLTVAEGICTHCRIERKWQYVVKLVKYIHLQFWQLLRLRYVYRAVPCLTGYTGIQSARIIVRHRKSRHILDSINV